MKYKIFLLFLFSLIHFSVSAQDRNQYFDGADTAESNSIQIKLDPSLSNIWQIGKPQKTFFDSAATQPIAIVTDSVNYYPINNNSSFEFTIVPWSSWGIIAIQWKQKLDMDAGLDGGKIEFSVDGGTTWQNSFNNPNVYNFYGFQTANQDTLQNGEYAFSGQDTTWRDIWLCYDMTWIDFNDSINVRYTFMSDGIDNNKEGWLIDNFKTHITYIHTISENKQDQYLNVYPNPANNVIHIQAQKLQEYHIIKKMELINLSGTIVDSWENIPTKYFINTQKYSSGSYYLKIQTNLKSETIPIIINNK